MAKKNEGSITERTPGVWSIQMDLGQDAKGKRIRKTYTVKGSRADAELERWALVKRMADGELAAHNATSAERIETVGTWLEKWFKGARLALKTRTQDNYRRAIDHFINPALGHIALAELTPMEVRTWQTDLLDTYSTSTVRLARAVLSAAYNEAVGLEVLARNPVPLAKFPKQGAPAPGPMPSLTGIKAALNIWRDEGHPFYAALFLAAYTGMRRGELAAVRWSRINMDTGVLAVDEQRTVSDSQGVISIAPKTDHSLRFVELNPAIMAVLATHRDQQDAYRRGLDLPPTDYVFTGPKGEPVHPGSLQRAIRTLGRRVGENITVRSLRHFHASYTVKAGGSIRDLSARLGHASTSITMNIYAHSQPDWQREGLDKFSGLMADGMADALPDGRVIEAVRS